MLKASSTELLTTQNRLEARVTTGFGLLGADVTNVVVVPSVSVDDDEALHTALTVMKRTETRVVRGFDTLGVDVTKKPFILVDDNEGTVTINSLNTTVGAIIAATAKYGTSRFSVVYNGVTQCILLTKGKENVVF
jgi:hypothetical protein